MSKKSSLLVGTILGSLVAGATIYVMKTENGQVVKERTKEKLLKLKDETLQYMEEKGYQPSEMKEKLQNLITGSDDAVFTKNQANTIVLSTPDQLQQEFSEIENEIQHLEKHLHQNN